MAPHANTNCHGKNEPQKNPVETMNTWARRTLWFSAAVVGGFIVLASFHYPGESSSGIMAAFGLIVATGFVFANGSLRYVIRFGLAVFIGTIFGAAIGGALVMGGGSAAAGGSVGILLAVGIGFVIGGGLSME